MALLLYGPGEDEKKNFLETLQKKHKARFIHRFGAERPIGIDDVHEIRRRAGLEPGGGEKQVFILEQADAMTHEAAEALLKIVEEPPASSELILLALSPDLPRTLLSRLAAYPFFDWAADSGDIASLKARLEKEIKERGSVPADLIRAVWRSLAYATMTSNVRISKRAIEDAYELVKKQ